MSDTLKSKTIFLLIGIILISLVSGQQSPGDYRLNQPALLYQTCSNCTYVNITNVILGDKTNLTFVNQSMNRQGTYYWYILNASYINYPGTYIISGNANPDGQLTVWNYEFKVSQLAINQSTSQAIGSAIFLILMILLMFTFGSIGVKLSKSNNWWILGIFFMFFASLLLVYNTFLGYQFHLLFTGLPDSSLPAYLFWMLLMIIVLGFLTSLTLLFIQWRKVLRYVKREIRRKEPNDEDLEDWDVDRWGGENWAIKGGRR